MKKVLVYGGKEDAIRTTQAIEAEVPVEIDCKIARKKFFELSSAEIVEETENDLFPILGENELIVLSNPLDAIVTGDILKSRYPKQKFISYGQGIAQAIKKLKAVYILVSMHIRRRKEYQMIKAECQQTEIRESDGEEWRGLIENRLVSKEEIMERVKSAQGAPIIVFHPELPFYRIKELVDWRNEMVDMEEMLVRAVKAELGLEDWC